MKKFAIPVLVIIILLSSATVLMIINSRDNSEEPSVIEVTQPITLGSISVSEDGKEISYQGISPLSPLAILKTGYTVQTEENSNRVVAINGINEKGSKSWVLLINNQESNVDPGLYKSSDNDQITWIYR